MDVRSGFTAKQILTGAVWKSQIEASRPAQVARYIQPGTSNDLELEFPW